MKRKKLIILFSFIIIIVCIIFCEKIIIRIKSKNYNLQSLDTTNIPTPVEKIDDDYAVLTNITMHYEVYGDSGKELILLHGNGGSCDTLRELATYLGNEYIVYLIESRCHGKSTVTNSISYIDMANDVYDFINVLDLDKPYFVGHSDGGMVGLALASMYPDSISALISCGSNSNPNTFKPYFTGFVLINNLFNPSILNDLMLNEPNYTKEFLSNITCDTLIVAAEHDIMYLEDSIFIHESISNSSIMIIKDADHCSYIENDGKQGYILVHNYLSSLDN